MKHFRVKNIFNQRLRAHVKGLYDLYKSTIDWVTWLYIIIPVIAIISYHYYRLWKGPWSLQISQSDGLSLLLLILFAIIANGNVRFYLERGDQLFFRQFERHYILLKKFGMIYSFIVHFIIVCFFFFVIAPIALVQLRLSLSMYVCLFLIVLLSRIFLSIVKQFFSFRFIGWKYYVVYILWIITFFLLYHSLLYVSLTRSNVMLLSVVFIILAVVTLYIVHYRLYLQGVFEKEMEIEVMLKYRFVTFVLQSASFIGAPRFQRLKSKKVGKRPWLFRNSGTIFKKRTGKNAYLELHIKYILRNKSKWSILLQLLGVSFFAIFIAPNVLKWVIWGFVIIIFNQMNRSFTNEINRSVFLKTFHWNEKQMLNFSMNSVFWINLPFMILIGAWTGLLLFPYWGILIFSAATVGISYFIQLFNIS